MEKYEYFEVSENAGIAEVVMDRPPVNVLHNPMMEEFNSILADLCGNDNLAAIVIRAKGKAFSAGVDVADHTADRVADMMRLFHGIFRKMATTDALIIAAVNGAALGGGCELACFCDIVLASDRAKFGQPEVHVGVFPPVAACVFPHQVGLKKAVELTALGGTISAAEAHRVGLVNQVYEAAEFDAQIDSFVEGIRKLSRPVVRLAKRATSMMAREQILDHLDKAEKLYLDELMKLADVHEGVDAFMNKRPAVWSHA